LVQNIVLKYLAYFVIFILCLLVYIVFVGSVSIYDIVTGVIGSILVTILTTKYIIQDVRKLTNVNRLIYLLKYFVVFIRAEIACHIDVIKRIITGRIAPGIVRVPYELKSDYAITLTACSIINTPGTVVVDIDREEHAFYVHWIDIKTIKPEEIRREVSYIFEKFAQVIFD